MSSAVGNTVKWVFRLFGCPALACLGLPCIGVMFDVSLPEAFRGDRFFYSKTMVVLPQHRYRFRIFLVLVHALALFLVF